ncbi:MAG: GNAT family N-acetyltransferase [Pirellulales bacterium]|nr:GNAT family N-acetyltransferase [Pirellulales bacterium]
MRKAVPKDIPTLLGLMSEFYAESGHELDHALAERAFAAILAEERLGQVWLIDDENKNVGYLVLTLRFGMEYGGLIGCLDDLFVVPPSRNQGLSTAALTDVRDFCKASGIRALTVEVGFSNGPAQAVYRRVGLTAAPDRQLLALALARPTHVI